MKITFIKNYVLLIGLVWSLVCMVVLGAHLRDDYRQTVARTQARASTMLERDILYRDWVASHGGVYVPVTETSLPNPHLAALPERDVETGDGRRLTLVNPSYMTQQAFALDNRAGRSISKITGLRVINPANAPDAWERAALRQLAQGAEAVSEVVEFAGHLHVRAMRPFHVEETCLKCHGEQGYRIGEVGGGISVALPFESFMSGHWEHNFLSVGLFGLLWIFGLFGLVLLGRRLSLQTRKAIESEHQLDRAEMNLNFLSNYDRRTNLPNRFKFEEQLCDVFRIVDVSGDTVAVTALEIRNFKQIINSFDHPVGDTLFRMLAERMATLLTELDSVARFGEDRLLFSYTCQDGDLFSESILQQLLAAASKPLVLEDHEFFPVVCMGTALYPHDAEFATRLVHKAVSALTFCVEKKQSGINLYSQSLQEEAKNRLEIESGLRRALAEQGFQLFLQPQVDSISGDLIGAEALLRWNMEGRGNVPPDEFIPVAEENGLILPIGEWVLQTACIQAVCLRQRFDRIIPVGVNVSAKQFQDPAFVDILDEVLSIDGMLPEMLEIEITEGTFMEDIDLTIEILTDLKVRGLRIAIDDFGTGYSSLSYLKKFPIDRLKIDRSFVADIASDEDDRVLAGLIAEMGRKLGLNVIAEGVENADQKHLLIGMGCHAMQGYLFGRPVAFEDFCTRFKDLAGRS